VKHRMTSLYFK